MGEALQSTQGATGNTRPRRVMMISSPLFALFGPGGGIVLLWGPYFSISILGRREGRKKEMMKRRGDKKREEKKKKKKKK